MLVQSFRRAKIRKDNRTMWVALTSLIVFSPAWFSSATAQTTEQKQQPAENAERWSFVIGVGIFPFEAEAFSQDMHYNDGFDDYFINPDQDEKSSVVTVMVGAGRSLYQRGSLVLDANLTLNVLLNSPLTGLVFELAAEPRWSVTQRLNLFARLAGGVSGISGEVGKVPLGNNTGAPFMISPSGTETAPVGSIFNMEGYSFGGAVGGGAGIMITPRFGLQGDLVYHGYGDIDNWTIRVKSESVDGESKELFEMDVSDFESDGRPGAIGTSGLSFGFSLLFRF